MPTLIVDEWRQEMFAKLEIWILSECELSDCCINAQVVLNQKRYGWKSYKDYGFSMFPKLPKAPVRVTTDWRKFGKEEFQAWLSVIQKGGFNSSLPPPVSPGNRKAVKTVFREWEKARITSPLKEGMKDFLKKEEKSQILAPAVELATIPGVSTELAPQLTKVYAKALTLFEEDDHPIFGRFEESLNLRVMLLIEVANAPKPDITELLASYARDEIVQQSEILVDHSVLTEILKEEPICIEFSDPHHDWDLKDYVLLRPDVTRSPFSMRHKSDCAVLATVSRRQRKYDVLMLRLTKAWLFSIERALMKRDSILYSPKFAISIPALLQKCAWQEDLRVEQILTQHDEVFEDREHFFNHSLTARPLNCCCEACFLFTTERRDDERKVTSEVPDTYQDVVAELSRLEVKLRPSKIREKRWSLKEHLTSQNNIQNGVSLEVAECDPAVGLQIQPFLSVWPKGNFSFSEEGICPMVLLDNLKMIGMFKIRDEQLSPCNGKWGHRIFLSYISVKGEPFTVIIRAYGTNKKRAKSVVYCAAFAVICGLK
jgi:hypothetical protein